MRDSGALMTPQFLALTVFLSLASPSLSIAVPQAGRESGARAAQQKALPQSELDRRSEAYYNFTMGHLYEEYYESTSRSEYANLAIDFYKKAYELDPRSPVIGERLAEIYAKAQRIREAVLEAQEILRRDPDNLPARRLLARIYLHTLGNLSGTPPTQRETMARATEQFREIIRLDPDDTESALWLTRLYRLLGETSSAEQVLREVLKREPENEAAVEQLTQLLLDAGKSDEAVALLERITGRSPTAGLLNLLGDAYRQTRDFTRAEQAYRQAAELEPGEVRHRRGLAWTLYQQGKYEAAREQYARLAEFEPGDPDNYLRLAQIDRQMKQLDKAEDNILRAKQIDPGSLEVLYTEAKIYEAQGRFEDAIRVLSDASGGLKPLATTSPAVRDTLGAVYEQLGALYREVENYTAAVAAFEDLGKLGEEQDRRARILIIDTLRAGRNLPGAIAAANQALERYPNDRDIRISYALLLGEMGDTAQAARQLRTLLKQTAGDREIYLDLAQVYERGRWFAEAEQAAQEAEKLSIQPADSETVWFLLGAIYERQKKFDQAEEQFRRALAVNPRNAPVLNYYGYMLADRGVRLDESVALVERALAEDPHNGAYLDSLGWAFFKQGRLPEAETYLRKAVARQGSDPTIREHLGEVFYKTGRHDLAAAEWEKALAAWKRVLPSESEAERVAELGKKLAGLKHRLAQQKPGSEAKPQ